MTRSITRTAVRAAALLLPAGLLAACASNPPLDTDRAQVDFPAPEQAWVENGITPNLENLSKIAPGMTKDQLYALVGRPHFSEGLFNVRRWNYLFHLPAGENQSRRCQYQVQYDDMRVARTFWRSRQCEQLLTDALAPPEPVPQVVTRRSLEARTLFDFDSDRLSTEGRQRIQAVVREVDAEFTDPRIRVVGHTDLIGSADYNMALSLRRAESVRQALVGGGIAAAAIEISGVGESHRVKSCPAALSGARLRDCLRPNRRVEIEIRPGDSATSASD